MASVRNHLGFHDQVRARLGLRPKQKLPLEGMPPVEIDGYTVWVVPQRELLTGRHLKRSTHRTVAQCPGCHAVVSVGRLHQHYCTRFRKGVPVRVSVVMALQRMAFDTQVRLTAEQAGVWVSLFDAAFDLHTGRQG